MRNMKSIILRVQAFARATRQVIHNLSTIFCTIPYLIKNNNDDGKMNKLK